jgi:hypothetical protein
VTLEPGKTYYIRLNFVFLAIAFGTGGGSLRALSDRVFPQHIAAEEEVMGGEFSTVPARGTTGRDFGAGKLLESSGAFTDHPQAYGGGERRRAATGSLPGFAIAGA